MNTNKVTITADTIISIFDPATYHFGNEFFGWCFELPNPRFRQEPCNGQKWAQETIQGWCDKFHIEPEELEKVKKYLSDIVDPEEEESGDVETTV
ncbi:Hypothetical protein HVR_LOCUS782 [uncultured virus]|nr:Hypothetical protein HVR_LOCUS782 [uncultured virus]